VKLRALNIERLAGLRHGLKLEPQHLDGRVRVLHGPNAIGKSSIVRALKALLWDEDAPVTGRVEIEARFEIDGVEWTARRDGERTSWLRDGAPTSAPRLPAWSGASQMLMGLEDLGLGAETDIQEHVQRELRGGYDVVAVETALRPGKQAGLVHSRALADAENALRLARAAQDSVVRESTKLDDLRRDLSAAREATRRVTRLECALELAQSKSELALAQAELDGLPDGLERLRGDEAEQLERIQKRLVDARTSLADARSAETRLSREIAQLGLADTIATAVLDELADRIAAVQEIEAPLRAAESALARARAREMAAALVFGAGADLDRLAGLDESLDAEVESFARDASALAQRQDEIRAQLATLEDAETVEPLESRATAALEDWLRTPDAPTVDARARRVLFVLAGLIFVLSIALAFVHPAFASIALLAIVALYGARSVSTVRVSTRTEHEAAYQRTAESPPTAWTADAVRTRLAALHARAAQAAQAQVRAERRGQLEAKSAIAAKDAQQVAQRRENLAGRFGATVLAPDGLLVAFAKVRNDLRDARRDREENAADVETLTRSRGTAMFALNAGLRTSGAAEVSDLVAARVRVNDLRNRSAGLQSLQKERDGQIELARRARRDLEVGEAECAAVFQRSGLEPGDERGLASRSERLGAWKSTRERRDGFLRDVARLGRDLDDVLAAATPEWIADELSAAREASARTDELASAVTTLETRVELAREGRVLENALAERDDCRGELEAAFSTAQRGALASALLADVREAHEETSRPRLIEEASVLFSRFTLHRYELRMEVENTSLVLRARDTENAGALLALEQLSAGTRAQLLLAARLAYLREIEAGNPLPVVLDDALATSDPARKREIGAALLHVARSEDRQFIVLTTDADDLSLLRTEDALPGEVEATNLADLRAARVPVAAREHLRAPDVARVPAIDGCSGEQYAAALAGAGLPVRPFEPQREIDELHLWWVLHHELGLLRDLLALRIDSVGAFRNATRVGVPLAGDRQRALAAPWIAFAQGMIEAWRVGRGRPLDADVLDELGISERYRADLISLARDLRGDTKAWLEALREREDERTHRYHAKKVDEHRDQLVQSGHLDERDVLEREEVWVRALTALPADHGIGGDELRARFELLWRSSEA